MRLNEPVTQREFEFDSDATLMSTTDTQSYIQYANAAFIAVSGFDRGEVSGQAHNMVRHPDMPPEAFADMWRTLKNGESWSALVKNRRKDGDHYWVRANATRVVRNGQVVGYMSVRTKPSRTETAAAEELYRRVREGRAKGIAFYKGLVVRTGLLRWTSLQQTMGVVWRIRFAILALLAVAVGSAVLTHSSGQPLWFAAATMAMGTVAVCWWLESQIVKPLRAVLNQAQAVAAGNPQRNVTLNRVDEIGMLLRAVNQAGLNLTSLVDDVSEQITGLRAVSREISQGNSDLSSRTEQTMERLKKIAVSMDQSLSTVESCSKAAARASERASAASAAAVKGGDAVNQAVSTMGEISQSSKKIEEITSVIDSIAFQTNILALNAAVEAARAGEQGRGFAVVAAEVRSLAQRSAAAAKEIKQLIASSVDRVEAGARIVGSAGTAMTEIVSQVRGLDLLIGEISAQTKEQAASVHQVNTAISELDQATEQNAVLVDESAETARKLSGQAEMLFEAVQVFKPEVSAKVIGRRQLS